jgi:hypothetical protein
MLRDHGSASPWRWPTSTRCGPHPQLVLRTTLMGSTRPLSSRRIFRTERRVMIGLRPLASRHLSFPATREVARRRAAAPRPCKRRIADTQFKVLPARGER